MGLNPADIFFLSCLPFIKSGVHYIRALIDVHLYYLRGLLFLTGANKESTPSYAALEKNRLIWQSTMA